MASPNENPAYQLGYLLGELFKAGLLLNLTKCTQCKRPINQCGPDWIVQTFLTIPIGAKCADCQTPEERAECAIRQAAGTMYKLDGIRLVELDPEPEHDDGGDEGGSQPKAG